MRLPTRFVFRRWLFFLYGVLLLATGLFAAALWTLEEEKPQGDEGLKADHLARQIQEVVGSGLWDKQTLVSWTIKIGEEKRQALWDRGQGLVFLRWGEGTGVMEIHFSLRPPWRGAVLRGGKTLESPLERQRWLRIARFFWLQDRRWAQPFSDLFAANTRRRLVRGFNPPRLLIEHLDPKGRVETALLFHLRPKPAGKGFFPTAWQIWAGDLMIQGLRFSFERQTSERQAVQAAQTAEGWTFDEHRSSLFSVLVKDRCSGESVFRAFERRRLERPLPLVEAPEPPALASSGSRASLGLLWLAFLAASGLGLAFLFRSKALKIALPSDVEHPLRYLYLWPSLLPKEVCHSLLEEAEGRTWTTDRHHQATQDQPLESLPKSGPHVDAFLRQAVFPRVADTLALSSSEVDLIEAFVVRYDLLVQKKLDLHRDASIATLSIALNDGSAYEGGGTYFPSLGEVVRCDHAGDALLHCGKVRHGGSSIRAGVRYLLVCFLDLSGCPAFDHETIATWDSATPEDFAVLSSLYRKETSAKATS